MSKQLLKNFAIRSYICAQCGKEYDWNTEFTDKEMKEEYAGNFPNDTDMLEDVAVVCDDCYKKMGLE